MKGEQLIASIYKLAKDRVSLIHALLQLIGPKPDPEDDMPLSLKLVILGYLATFAETNLTDDIADTSLKISLQLEISSNIARIAKEYDYPAEELNQLINNLKASQIEKTNRIKDGESILSTINFN
jgi:hypothetical protein